MVNFLREISPLGLSIGLVLGINVGAGAHSVEIDSLTEFYNYYDSGGNAFTPSQKRVIGGIFDNIAPYFGSDGLNNAIASGFIPLTQELIGHGTHWLNPRLVDITNLQANPLLPAGLNFDENGHLAAVFWTQELYGPLVPLVQQLEATVGLNNLDPMTLTQLYTLHKQNTLQPEPTIFNMFPRAAWHHHENVVIENLGIKNSSGMFDPQLTNFRQSLPDANFIDELLTALADPSKVLAPLESDFNLGYPPFNRAISPGFYMLHMWVGQGNHEGLFAETNHDIPVSANAIPEALTFEDGSGGHDGMGMGHSSDPIPEPSSVMGILALAFLSLVRGLNR